MASPHKLALIIRNISDHDQFLLLKQTPPPKFNDEEYDSYIDSDLWDLPSTQLNPLEGDSLSRIFVNGAESCLDNLNLNKLDIESALDQVLSEVGLQRLLDGDWRFEKYVQEPEFGPGTPVKTVFLTGKLKLEDDNLRDVKWMSVQNCENLLLEVKPTSDRLGPLVVAGIFINSAQPRGFSIPLTIQYQEYPPGIKIVPMRSRTAMPFRTTNIVIVAPDNVHDDCNNSNFVAYGDALIIDPGCLSECHAELSEVVAALPRKLVVFVTHHHHDHVDGLSVIQKCNPDAILLAHENTMRRIGKGDWSCGYTTISGDEEICIRGQRFNVIFAPGHTDGHMALLDVRTQSLIVGDHCVGQGSAVLDISSGGNMKAYFQTTYNFLELSPNALIPMHGRVNLWPKKMLCGYLKNRRSRESSILEAIESGAETLFDIVAKTYQDVSPSYWLPASWNVRLHVDHLAQQDKLPKEFSVEKFKSTCRLHFVSRWTWARLRSGLLFKDPKLRKFELVGASVVAGIAVTGIAVLCGVKAKLTAK